LAFADLKDFEGPHHPRLGMRSVLSYAQPRREIKAMSEDLEQIKQRLPLLEYLQRHNWTGNLVGAGDEFVGLCPLHPNTRKLLSYVDWALQGLVAR
jgi:hypothetical protein